MCPQEHFSKKTLDYDVIRKNVDWARVDEIEMQGGEILAMKDAKALYLWLTAGLGKKVNIITNGVLIDDAWADHLVKGADWIQISVNAATKLTHELVNRKSSFDRVIANIKKLVAAKQEYALAVRIIFKYTIVAENVHEIADAILFAEDIGCDEIHFGYDAKVRDYLENNPEVMLKLRDDIARQLSRDHQIFVEHDRLQHLNLLD
jgi:MoaA/NifB/PqqE/SkfB family radical SAM enzyme